MDKATLLELAERVEALASPDRAMDAEIFKAIGAPVPFQFANKLIALEFNDVEQAYFARVSDDMRVRYSPPSYTASIDAALTLVPKGLVYNLGNDTAFCWAYIWDDTPDYDGEPYEGRTSTPPCAIVAACLRARGSQEEPRAQSKGERK